MKRLLGICTSRWMYVVGLALAIAVGRFQSWWLLIALYIFVGVVVGAILIASIPAFRKLNDAWRKYPDTPEAEEYTRRREDKIKENDKNKIEIR